MRHPRIKPDQLDTFMHVYNRTAGQREERPFGNREKARFLQRVKKLNRLYVIEVLAVTVMDTHFHVLLHVPEQVPSNEETARRYNEFYEGVYPPMDPGSKKCSEYAVRLRDVSVFMHHLQQPFTRWFNGNRGRRGPLWANRFKNTILESGRAVWDCWKYIEMNPVRAGLAQDPADYRFCSFGEWSGSGKHPFAAALETHLLPGVAGLLRIDKAEELQARLRQEFARVRAEESRKSPQEVEEAVIEAGKEIPFSTRLDRRVRYWVDGLVIGSDLFVLNTVSVARVKFDATRRRMKRAVGPGLRSGELSSFKRLREIVT